MACVEDGSGWAQALLDGAYVDGPPVSMCSIAAYVGARLLRTRPGPYELPRSVSGLLQPSTRTILVNHLHPITRQRFTAAHEMGHLVTGVGVREFALMIESGTNQCTSDEERAMNVFAAELLMPRAWVEQSVAAGLPFGALCRLFACSRQAMTARLQALEVMAR